MSRKPAAIVQYKLRIREVLRRRIEQAAKKRGVSANYEMSSRLERSFEQEALRTIDQIADDTAVNWAKFGEMFHELAKQGDLLRAAEATTVAGIRQISGPRHPQFPDVRHFALEIRDESMDAVTPLPLTLGAHVLCIDLAEAKLIIESGNLYAIRRALDHDLVETIIRRARVFADRVELIAESSHRNGQQFEKITIEGHLTTDPKAQVYAFGLVYYVGAFF